MVLMELPTGRAGLRPRPYEICCWEKCVPPHSHSLPRWGERTRRYIFARIEYALAVFARDGEGCLKGEEEMSPSISSSPLQNRGIRVGPGMVNINPWIPGRSRE
jgi:hypothetical protein